MQVKQVKDVENTIVVNVEYPEADLELLVFVVSFEG